MLTLFNAKMIDELMTTYVKGLVAGLGDNLNSVTLFGSCARGDHEVGSDIDVFILVRDKNPDTVKLINSLSDSIDWQYDTLIANIIRSCDMYDQYKNDSLYSRIRQEGKVYYGAA